MQSAGLNFQYRLLNRGLENFCIVVYQCFDKKYCIQGPGLHSSQDVETCTEPVLIRLRRSLPYSTEHLVRVACFLGIDDS